MTPFHQRLTIRDSQKKSSFGLRIFILGLAFSYLLGASFRSFFSSEALSGYLSSLLRAEGASWNIQIQGAELRLRRGLLPDFGLFITTVEVFERENLCPSEPKALLQQTWIPFRIGALLRGQILPRKALIESMYWREAGFCLRQVVQQSTNSLWSLHHIFKRSEQPWILKNEVNGEPAFSDSSLNRFSVLHQAQSSKENLMSFFKRLERLRQEVIPLPELQVQNLRIEGSQPVQLKKIRAVLQEMPWILSGSLERKLGRLQRTPLSVPFQIAANPSSMQMTLGSELGEGHWNASALFEQQQEQVQTKFALDIQTVPLSLLIPLLRPWTKSFGFEHFDFTWLNCKLHWQGELGEFGAKPWTLQYCSLTGRPGEIHWATKELKLDEKGPVLDLKFSFRDVQSLTLLLPQDLAKFLPFQGLVQGELKRSSAEGLSLEAILPDSQNLLVNGEAYAISPPLQVHLTRNENKRDLWFQWLDRSSNSEEVTLKEGGDEFTGQWISEKARYKLQLRDEPILAKMQGRAQEFFEMAGHKNRNSRASKIFDFELEKNSLTFQAD